MSRLDVDQIEIKGEKLANYLLNLNHPDGGPKAKFFISHGFSPNDPSALASALAHHAFVGWPGVEIPTIYGRKHKIITDMALPDGSVRSVVAIWQVNAGESVANLVTAYPE